MRQIQVDPTKFKGDPALLQRIRVTEGGAEGLTFSIEDQGVVIPLEAETLEERSDLLAELLLRHPNLGAA